MATKSLGTLTLDLVAKIGGFTGPMDAAGRHAEKNAKQMARAAKEAREQWALYGKVALGALVGIAGVGFARFIKETKEAEQEQAQLSAVLRSTGEAAGFSQGALNEMADTLEAISTFSGGEITEAQTALLAFTGIVGDEFTRALEAATNMATRTGLSVVQAAETIGRSLDIPSKGMAALSKQGFRFTEDQKKVVAQLEATGRTAEAQGIILAALEESYGGAAEAARGTFGGSLTALNNTISGLLTGSDGSLDAATGAINDLNSALSDPAVREGLVNIANGLLTIGRVSVEVLAEVGSFTKWLGEEIAALNHGIAFDDLIRQEELLRELEELQGKGAAYRFAFAKNYMDDNYLKEQIDLQREHVKQLQKTQELMAKNANRKPQGDPYATLSKSLDELIGKSGLYSGVLDEKAIMEQAEATATAEAALKKLNLAYDSQLEKFREQMALTGDATELEQIRYAITQGNLVGINEGQQKRLEGLAAELDAINAVAAAEKERAAAEKELMGDYESVRSTLLTQEEQLREAAQERFDVIEAAFVAGIIAEDQFATSAERNTALLGEQIDALKNKTSELDEFTRNAAESIQNELSDALIAGFDGGGDDLLKRWGDLIKRMLADAVAADLTRALFGQGNATGGGSDTGQLIGGLAGMFAGFFDSGGSIPSGKFGIVGERGPELVSGPATVTGRLDTAAVLRGAGGQHSITNNLTVQGRIDRRTESQIARDIAQKTRIATARG